MEYKTSVFAFAPLNNFIQPNANICEFDHVQICLPHKERFLKIDIVLNSDR